MTVNDWVAGTRFGSWVQRCRESRRLVLVIVAIALLLDNMLLTTVGKFFFYIQPINFRQNIVYTLIKKWTTRPLVGFVIKIMTATILTICFTRLCIGIVEKNVKITM